jgi:hypothetical protein
MANERARALACGAQPGWALNARPEIFLVQFLYENQKSVLQSFPLLARLEPTPLVTAASRRKETDFLFFPPQPFEKSRFGRIKPSKAKQFCLV